MIRIAICDDDYAAAGQLDTFIQNFCKDLAIEIDIEVYLSGDELIKALRAEQFFDLIYLDIQMDGINGIDVGNIIRNGMKNDVTQIVYVSAHDSFHHQLYSYRPIGFLKKPVEEQSFAEQFRYVLDKIEQGQTSFYFKIGRDTYTIAKQDIMFVESTGRKISLYTRKNVYQYYSTILKEKEKLQDSNFLQIHQSYIVNLDYVDHFNKEYLEIGNRTLPISHHRKKEVKEQMLRYLEVKAYRRF